ncbi:hypothetical protein ACH40D_39060 [Streptomyces olivaceoviridis]|uniref:Uncharacterized protein n=1 Tax=Streptomyces olivaceoviridis TaxID=1921 RepID=A0ABW7VJZ2_STROI|nr:hypothetical protein [Streptomyces corchorusii]
MEQVQLAVRTERRPFQHGDVPERAWRIERRDLGEQMGVDRFSVERGPVGMTRLRALGGRAGDAGGDQSRPGQADSEDRAATPQASGTPVEYM